MSSRQRKWAHEAYQQVAHYKGHELEKKIRTLCMKAPSLLHQSGLAQAVVFLRAREAQVGQTFADMLAMVLHQTRGDMTSGAKLQEQALGIDDLSEYMALTQDVSDVAAWLRRFAQIELKAEESNNAE